MTVRRMLPRPVPHVAAQQLDVALRLTDPAIRRAVINALELYAQFDDHVDGGYSAGEALEMLQGDPDAQPQP